MDNILNIYLPKEIKLIIAVNSKQTRLSKGYKRETLANLSGVSLSSIKRFETTGDISLSSLLRIASALGCLNTFIDLFKIEEPKTLDELEKKEKKTNRKRGRK